jgi:hypothetical protein
MQLRLFSLSHNLLRVDTMATIQALTISVCCFCLGACELQGPSHPKTHTTVSALAFSGGAEFRHQASVSKFRIGAHPQTTSENRLSRLTGDDGVFAVDETNGAVVGLENGSSPASVVGPLTTDSDMHNEVVAQYFESAGLPAAEVGGIHANAVMSGGMSATGQRLKDKLVGFSSVITRRLAGVRVEESFAWARFNRDGESVAEAAYWPAIASQSVQDAIALNDGLQDPAQAARYLAQIQKNNPDVASGSIGEVVIHHSSSTVRQPAVALASYDIVFGAAGTKPRVRHFDAVGKEFTLPWDVDVVGPAAPIRGAKSP